MVKSRVAGNLTWRDGCAGLEGISYPTVAPPHLFLRWNSPCRFDMFYFMMVFNLSHFSKFMARVGGLSCSNLLYTDDLDGNTCLLRLGSCAQLALLCDLTSQGIRRVGNSTSSGFRLVSTVLLDVSWKIISVSNEHRNFLFCNLLNCKQLAREQPFSDSSSFSEVLVTLPISAVYRTSQNVADLLTILSERVESVAKSNPPEDNVILSQLREMFE